MENVPRVAGILEKELLDGSLKRFRNLVKVIKTVDCADYGVPQNRKRMIAGDFPVSLFESYKLNIPPVTLGDVLHSLSVDMVIDPSFGYKIPRQEITELENEASLTSQEERISRDSKSFHPIYNNMSFPDRLNRPSRTVTATCTRVSRESIVVESGVGYRRLNVRERGVVQGFPITYQFYGKTLNSKFKMIGNAVPPVLTYYIFQSMLGVKAKDIKPPNYSEYFHNKPEFKSHKSKLGLPIRKYPIKRKFKFAVPNLRYGSGVRFELSNDPKSEDLKWSFKFYFGNSKNIKNIALDNEVRDVLAPIVNTTKNEIFTDCINQIEKKYKNYNSEKLQEFWVSDTSNMEVFEFLDDVGNSVETILDNADFTEIDDNIVEIISGKKNKKLGDNKESLLTGMYLLSSLNTKLFI